ncbi:MAG TPA: hypothetical protein DCE44_13210, partial [Verrucomicrobiales bacterium]|nr:hypothetical protein [Verrucomicrobiales bacterium]
MCNQNDFLRGGGEMGERMRIFDWSKTPLGPAACWPQSLRSLLSMMLPSKAQIILFWGPEYVVFYNDAYRPVLGAKHPQALGQPGGVAWKELWDAGANLHSLLDGVIRTGEAFTAKDMMFIMERHGFVEEAYFDVSYDPVRIESGEVGGVYCIVTETTGRVIGERRLTLLRDLAARNATARTAHDACVLAIETLAAKPHDVPFAAAYLDGELQACTPGIQSEQLQELKIGSVGRLVVGLNSKRPFDEQYRSFLELVADQLDTAIANARAYEAERERAEALAQLDRAKTAFFSNVSHEFRTPLTLMLGPVEELLAGRHGDLKPDAKDQLETVNRNGLRLLRLVNNLLDFSRIEAGRIQARYEATDLAAFTAELASSFRSATERAGLRLIVDCPPLSETAYVDHDMWEKIVLNLLSNAFKFTFEGQIEISLKQGLSDPSCPSGDRTNRIDQKDQMDAHHVTLRVRDTGVGIPAEAIPHIFERFYRVENMQSRTHEGSGIGLALVQELAKFHKGSVRVESRIGEGSTFFVSVPLGSAHLSPEKIGPGRTRISTAVGAGPFVEEALRWIPEADRGDESEELLRHECPPVTAPTSAQEEKRDRPLIVLADDNADMRHYIGRLLAERYRVISAPDGEAALSVVRRDKPDLVLSDMMMPRLDGFGLLRAIREDAALKTIPVILLSARAEEDARIEGLKHGADDYLIKPFSAKELLARVEAHVRLAQVRRESEDVLRESETRFRTFADSAPTMLWVTEPDGSCSYLSRGWYELTGQTEQTGLGYGWLDAIHPDDRAASGELFRAANDKHEPFSLVYRVRRSDGEYRWALDAGRPRFGTTGEFLGYIGSVIDITERKQVEQQLQNHSERLATVLDAQRTIAGAHVEYTALLDLILERMMQITGAEGASLEMVEENDMVYEAAVGIAASFVGLRLKAVSSLSGLCHTSGQCQRADDTDTDPRVDREVCRRIGLRSMIVMPLRYGEESFGVLKIVSSRPSAFGDAVEHTLRLMSEFLGMTIVRKRAEQALLESETRFRTFFENAAVGAAQISPDGRFRHVNERYCRITGYSRNELLGKMGPHDLDHPDDINANRTRVAELFNRGTPHLDFEKRYIHKDGHTVWVSVTVAPIRDHQGRTESTATIIQDVTARKQAETAFQEHAEQ